MWNMLICQVHYYFGCLLPISWASLKETWVQSLGWKNPLEEGMATHSIVPVWRIPMDKGARQATVHGVAKSRTQLSD